jgi:hypothetical protein
MHQANSIWLGALLLLAGCAGQQPAATPPLSSTDARALIEQSLPRSVADRNGWSSDIYQAFSVLTVTPDRENICAVVAVIEQESGFRVDPVIPGLGAIARREIASRAEKDLSDVFEDFIATVPMGKTLFAERNPIRTRGPMQVNVAFAEQFSSAAPYPYPVKSSIADELFTRRGSVYFGIAHLLDYRAPYDDYLYRFADFNAGQYASRNAAFQRAAGLVAGVPVATDGALLAHDADPNNPGATEVALRTLSATLKMSDRTIHEALAQGRTKSFEASALYQRVFALADRKVGRPLPRAMVPSIKLVGPKIKRNLSTSWYAHRVDDRFKGCLNAPLAARN